MCLTEVWKRCASFAAFRDGPPFELILVSLLDDCPALFPVCACVCMFSARSCRTWWVSCSWPATCRSCRSRASSRGCSAAACDPWTARSSVSDRLATNSGVPSCQAGKATRSNVLLYFQLLMVTCFALFSNYVLYLSTSFSPLIFLKKPTVP